MKAGAAHLLALIGLVAGCTTITPPGPTASTGQTQVVRAYHESIALSGRLSVHYQRDGRDESVHGSFNWTQGPDRTAITLLSPLGQTMAVIEVVPGRASLQQNGQAARVASDPDSLAAETLGWPLPVAGLREWLQGFVKDANGLRRQAAPGQSEELLTQDGWRLVYGNWQQDESGANRPKRIDISRDTNQAGAVAIRIVVDQWQPQ